MIIKNRCSVSFWMRIALIASIIFTMFFIFTNSSLPREESASQSGTIVEIIETIIPDEVPVKDLIIENIRKIAHFSEYGLLGIEIAVYIFFFMREKIYIFAPMSFAFCALVGFFDESIQMLSDRGPMISDVWIDIGGFATFTALSYAALYIGLGIIRLWRNRAKKQKPDGNI